MAIIVGKVKGKELFRRNLPETKTTIIGRGEEATIRMKIHGISREHTRIDFTNGRWIVSDLGSTNGTLVNGKKISSHPISRGDRIQIGNITLQIITEKQPPAAAKAAVPGTVSAKPRLSPRRRRTEEKPAEERESNTGGTIAKWVLRLIIWFVVIYSAWGYYEYMTMMKEAIECRNEGIDIHNEGRFGEAITVLEKSRTLKEKSRRNLFVKYAYPYLPQKELPIEEDVAKCYYERGNNLYNNQDENLDREALEDFEKAFRIRPDIPGLAKAMCPVAFAQSKWQLTLDSAEEVLRQDPSDTMIEKLRDMAMKELDKKRDRP